jgi:GTP-binding protein YchF
MTLNIGIVGLPNVGKSTVFNALTRAQNAAVANYPFCTIEPNKAVVPVPDDRLDKLHSLIGVPAKINTTIEFVDIAGLVRGASQGEGLGNQFLGNIRDADAIVHVVRCFADPNVVHVSETIDPQADVEIINVELILADLEQLQRKIERLERQVKGDKRFQPALELALALQDHLARGEPIRTYTPADPPVFYSFNREMRFLTAKPIIYAANVDEGDLAAVNSCVTTVQQVAAAEGAEVIVLCARLEEELNSLSAEEQLEYRALSGISESGLEQLIRKGYSLLNLISFFTFNEKQVRAWTVQRGWKAPQAAGVIHTDFERGFIRAEVVHHDTFVEQGSWTAAKTAGVQLVEGKEYVVQDGDVIYFRFNV